MSCNKYRSIVLVTSSGLPPENVLVKVVGFAVRQWGAAKHANIVKIIETRIVKEFVQFETYKYLKEKC